MGKRKYSKGSYPKGDKYDPLTRSRQIRRYKIDGGEKELLTWRDKNGTLHKRVLEDERIRSQIPHGKAKRIHEDRSLHAQLLDEKRPNKNIMVRPKSNYDPKVHDVKGIDTQRKPYNVGAVKKARKGYYVKTNQKWRFAGKRKPSKNDIIQLLNQDREITDPSDIEAGEIWVEPYKRQDGTKVSGHPRGLPS